MEVLTMASSLNGTDSGIGLEHGDREEIWPGNGLRCLSVGKKESVSGKSRFSSSAGVRPKAPISANLMSVNQIQSFIFQSIYSVFVPSCTSSGTTSSLNFLHPDAQICSRTSPLAASTANCPPIPARLTPESTLYPPQATLPYRA